MKDSSRLVLLHPAPAQGNGCNPICTGTEEPCACRGFSSPKALCKKAENRVMELLGKMVFARDFERLVSRFCLHWRFIWRLLFPWGGSVRRADAPWPRVQLSHSRTGCGEQPHRQRKSIWLNIPSAWFASENKACPMASSTQSRKSVPLADHCYCNEI